MSNPPQAGPATPDPRPRLPTTNHGPAATRIRAYQSDRASRTALPDRHPPSRPQPPPTSANAPKRPAAVDKRLSISVVGIDSGAAPSKVSLHGDESADGAVQRVRSRARRGKHGSGVGLWRRITPFKLGRRRTVPVLCGGVLVVMWPLSLWGHAIHL